MIFPCLIIQVFLFVQKRKRRMMFMEKIKTAVSAMRSKAAYLYSLFFTFLVCGPVTAYAEITEQESDLTDAINDLLNKATGLIMGITTATAALCAVICLFTMLFSKQTRNVDTAMDWLKRIAICWIAIMGINLIVKLFTGTFSGILS